MAATGSGSLIPAHHSNELLLGEEYRRPRDVAICCKKPDLTDCALVADRAVLPDRPTNVNINAGVNSVDAASGRNCGMYATVFVSR